MRVYRGWAAGVVVAALVVGAAVPQEPNPKAKLTPAQQAKLDERNRLWVEYSELKKAGKIAEAIAAVELIVALEREVFGEQHSEVAVTYQIIGSLHFAREDWPAARTARKQVLGILTVLHGKDDWRVTDARLALAEVDLCEKLGPEDRKAVLRASAMNIEGQRLLREGKYADAGERFDQSLAVYKRILGEGHPDTAAALNNLALLYESTGQYARAEPLYVQALAVYKKALGEGHPDTATGLGNLAGLYREMGQYAKAEPLYAQALATRRRALSEGHPDTAAALNNLAGLYLATGQYAKAEPLYVQALALWRKALGEGHPNTTVGLNNLAGLYREMGQYAKAEPLYVQVLATRRRVLGEGHPDTATSLNNLAELYRATGQYAKAEPLHAQALATLRRVLGEDHPNTTAGLSNLAGLYLATGQYAKAEPLARAALSVSLAHIDQTADVQPERGQLAHTNSVQHRLAVYLTITAALPGHPPAEAYALVLRWKGQVFVRQRRQRELLRAAADPDTARLVTDLLGVTRHLGTLFDQTPKPDQAAAWQQQLKELEDKREEIERELVQKSATFREQKEREALAPDRLLSLLPPNTALVDFLVYLHFTPNPKAPVGLLREERLVAFVARPGRGVVRVELGPFEPIRGAVENWRKETTRRRPVRKDTNGDDEPDDPAVILRDKLWVPVAKHLGGTDTVLVSPDADLAKLPFGALPGSKPGTYLIEELAVAVLPVPQFLPDVVAPPVQADPSLLAVGDVDYKADPGKPAAGAVSRAAARGDRGKGWDPLPATREELAAVRGAFRAAFPAGTATALRRAEPTEEAVRGQLGKHRWVHLATHGFFTDQKVREAAGGPGEEYRGRFVGQLPGLLSGVVLAGADRPIDPLSGADDGILTATEVSTLDLRSTEVVVLSACQTGLGEVAGGEGVLGLQRAFQVAGCRTTVTSLWTVPDDATQKLMTRAYGNWWGGKATKLGGLVEAQRWMIRAGLPAADKWPAVGAPVPPYYWAAFTLAGDWR